MTKIIKLIFFMLAGIFLSVQDIKNQKVSFILLILEALIISTISVTEELKQFYFISGFFNLFIFLMIKLSIKKIGTGDIYYSYICGLMLMPHQISVSMLLASVSALFLLVILRDKEQQKLPFIPFMFSGTLAVYLVN